MRDEEDQFIEYWQCYQMRHCSIFDKGVIPPIREISEQIRSFGDDFDYGTIG